MIRQLRTVLSAEWQGQYTSFLVWTGLYGVLQGLAVTLLVPVARSLQAADWAGAWMWIGALAVTAVACSIAHYVQAMGGFAVALAALRSMHLRIGDHLVTLPLGWFTGRTGSIAQIASKGTLSVGVVAAHLLTPVIIGITAASRPPTRQRLPSTTGSSSSPAASRSCARPDAPTTRAATSP